MQPPAVESKPKAPYSTQHKLPLKTLTWSTIALTIAMAVLYVLRGFPVSLDSYYQAMYFHSIGIGIAALAVYLVVGAFGLEADEPKVDYPLSARAWVAVLFAAVGGVIYLFPALDTALPDVGMGMYVVAFILLADVGGALYLELMLMPRKRYHVYDPSAGYYRRMFPFTKEMRKAYSGLGAAYWLAVAAVGSAFIAGLMGLVNLWVRIFGSSVFSGYISFLGLDVNGFLEATLDPHSHEIALAIMAGVVAIAVQQYGILDSLSRTKKTIARSGVWIAFFGVIGFTVVFLGVAFANYSPPTLFAGGPDGVNGVAGDDMVMAITAVGAMVLAVPMALAPVGSEGKPFWRDRIHASLLGAWVLAVIINVVGGFWVEFHEDQFSAALSANDAVFGQLQSLVGIFVLIGAAVILLSVDQFKVDASRRRLIGWGMGLGLLMASLGGLAWAFVDPSASGIWFGVHIIGILLIGAAGVISMLSILLSGT